MSHFGGHFRPPRGLQLERELSVGSSVVRPASDARPPRTRSRVTNGRTPFVEGDARSPWTRRWRDLVEAHASDLGGAAYLSEAQRSLIRRAATIEIELEQIEGRLSEGKDANLTTYAMAAGHLKRILETLGVERRPRNVLTLGEILRGG